MSSLIRFSIFCLIILMTGVPTARAQLIIAFSDDQGGSFSNNFAVATGDGITIDIFLQEIGTPTELSTDGIVGFGIELIRTPLSTGEISNVVENPFFDLENDNTLTSGGFTLEAFEVANTGLAGTSVPLASFDFQANVDATAEFSIVDNIPGDNVFDSFVTPTLVGLDSQIFSNGDSGAFNFTITSETIPEPSGALLLALIATWGTICRRRRK